MVLIGILIIGCTDTKYKAPDKVESKANIVAEPQPAPAPQQTKPAPSIVKTFKVGETATDNELKITLNNVRFVSKIDEQNNEYVSAEAPNGTQFAIVDITIENILPDKTQSISTILLTTINDQDGYNYDVDLMPTIALAKQFKDGEILPAMKKRGELAYSVPTSATDLKFIYKFDLVTGTSAVFDIK